MTYSEETSLNVSVETDWTGPMRFNRYRPRKQDRVEYDEFRAILTEAESMIGARRRAEDISEFFRIKEQEYGPVYPQTSLIQVITDGAPRTNVLRDRIQGVRRRLFDAPVIIPRIRPKIYEPLLKESNLLQELKEPIYNIPDDHIIDVKERASLFFGSKYPRALLRMPHCLTLLVNDSHSVYFKSQPVPKTDRFDAFERALKRSMNPIPFVTCHCVQIRAIDVLKREHCVFETQYDQAAVQMQKWHCGIEFQRELGNGSRHYRLLWSMARLVSQDFPNALEVCLVPIERAHVEIARAENGHASSNGPNTQLSREVEVEIIGRRSGSPGYIPN